MHYNHLITDNSLSWSCEMCGKCCRSFTNVYVTDTEANDLEQIRSRLPQDYLGQSLEKITEMKGTDRRLCHIEENEELLCPLLCNDGKTCALHCFAGYDVKPATCKIFPFSFRCKPDGDVIAGVSFFCPAIRRRHGNPMSEQRESIAKTLELLPDDRIAQLPNQLLLTKRVALTWEEYESIEAFLVEILSGETLSLSEKLIACRFVFRFIESFVEASTSPFQPMEQARNLPGGNPQLLQWIEEMRKSFSVIVEPLVRKTPKVSHAIRRILLANIAGLGALALNKKGDKPKALASLLKSYILHWTCWGTVKLAPFPIALPHKVLMSGGLPAKDTEAARLLEAYAKHVLFRKDLLSAPTLFAGLDFLLINFSLIRWYAAASAFQDHSETVCDEHYDNAVMLVERLFGLHSPILNVLGQHPALFAVIDQVRSQPHFPYLMLSS